MLNQPWLKLLLETARRNQVVAEGPTPAEFSRSMRHRSPVGDFFVEGRAVTPEVLSYSNSRVCTGTVRRWFSSYDYSPSSSPFFCPRILVVLVIDFLRGLLYADRLDLSP